jgi:hypothetical protein
MRAHLEALLPRAMEKTLLLQVAESGARWIFLAAAGDLRLNELDSFVRLCWPDLGSWPGAFVVGGQSLSLKSASDEARIVAPGRELRP